MALFLHVREERVNLKTLCVSAISGDTVQVCCCLQTKAQFLPMSSICISILLVSTLRSYKWCSLTFLATQERSCLIPLRNVDSLSFPLCWLSYLSKVHGSITSFLKIVFFLSILFPFWFFSISYLYYNPSDLKMHPVKELLASTGIYF